MADAIVFTIHTHQNTIFHVVRKLTRIQYLKGQFPMGQWLQVPSDQQDHLDIDINIEYFSSLLLETIKCVSILETDVNNISSSVDMNLPEGSETTSLINHMYVKDLPKCNLGIGQ